MSLLAVASTKQIHLTASRVGRWLRCSSVDTFEQYPVPVKMMNILFSVATSCSSGKESGNRLNINSKLVHGLVRLLACILLGANINSVSFAPVPVLDIMLGETDVEQLKYIPLADGYEFGYTLPNGAHRDEIGKVLSGTSAAKDLENANNLARNHRPSRENGLKVRKLSGKSLASLAG
ncbi:GL15512 [Drosophila persimilis]|uniref:GL15512 n=1 Tax=Drosophila persimilis TaxID=7234 RepID=B4H6H9_DROPE|nr:GL15512 [Drosophila persimilis]